VGTPAGWWGPVRGRRSRPAGWRGCRLGRAVADSNQCRRAASPSRGERRGHRCCGRRGGGRSRPAQGCAAWRRGWHADSSRGCRRPNPKRPRCRRQSGAARSARSLPESRTAAPPADGPFRHWPPVWTSRLEGRRPSQSSCRSRPGTFRCRGSGGHARSGSRTIDRPVSCNDSGHR
jgi:hypothetical protein